MSESGLRARSLEGKYTLVTRTRDQAGALSKSLRAVGAIPLELPVIRIVPPEDWSPLDLALQASIASAAYDWLIFTSANGVKMVMERLLTLGYTAQALQSIPIATIGPATAAALANYGLSAALVPAEYIAESVATGLRQAAAQHGETLAGKRILLARAAEARQVLITELEQAGATVDVVVAYQTLPVAHDDQQGLQVINLLRQQQLAIITFTSSSTVHHFMHWLSQSAQDIALLLTKGGQQASPPLIACIGPITAQTAHSYGLKVSVEAKEFTTTGLVEALLDYEEKN
jgi:uroporphyrinogen-III synthase